MKKNNNHLEQLIPLMSTENRKRYKDIKNFMREYLDIEDIENSEIVLEPTSAQDFVNFLFSILMKSETTEELRWSKRNLKEKYLDVEELYPFDNVDIEEVDFVNHSLNKLELAREMNEYIVLTSSQVEYLLTGLIKDYKNFTEDQRR